MRDFLAWLLIGMGQGGFFALLAIGVVVAFKGSGVINFAHGAMAMFCGLPVPLPANEGPASAARGSTSCPFKWLNIPVTLQLRWGRTEAGFLAGVHPHHADRCAASVRWRTSWCSDRCAMRHPLGKVIGSLGTMLYLQGVALEELRFRQPEPEGRVPRWHLQELPSASASRCPKDAAIDRRSSPSSWRLALWVFFQYTRFGLATRAAAGNEKGAVLLGYSPERLALSNWIISAGLAGLAGIFVGSITGALNPVKYTALIVPASVPR